jgi:hypothetical protein
MKTDLKWVPKMKKAIAIAGFGVLVGCQDGSLATPTMTTPTLSPQGGTSTAPVADLGFGDSELSDRDFTALALAQVNADRLEAGLQAATDCVVVAQFKGKQLFIAEDNNLALLAKNGTGEVGKADLAATGDLVFLWMPVSLNADKVSKGTRVAGICTSSAAPAPKSPSAPTSPSGPTSPPTTSGGTCNGQSAPSSVSCGKPTAKCKDGTYSCSQNRSGTCSSHGGVACWICPGALCQQSAAEPDLFGTSASSLTTESW